MHLHCSDYLKGGEGLRPPGGEKEARAGAGMLVHLHYSLACACDREENFIFRRAIS